MRTKIFCRKPRADKKGNVCTCGRYLGEVDGSFSLLCPLCHWVTEGDTKLPAEKWSTFPKPPR